MANTKTIIDDIRIAMDMDKKLQEDTDYFKHRTVLLDEMVKSMRFASLSDVIDVCAQFPELKERLLSQHEEKERASRANAAAWAGADMNNPSNRW